MVCKVLCSRSISQIIVHEADEPNAVFDFFDSEPLPGHDGRDVDLFAMHADAAAGCDENISVMERIVDSGRR